MLTHVYTHMRTPFAYTHSDPHRQFIAIACVFPYYIHHVCAICTFAHRKPLCVYICS